jgi:hypothetical protein
MPMNYLHEKEKYVIMHTSRIKTISKVRSGR